VGKVGDHAGRGVLEVVAVIPDSRLPATMAMSKLWPSRTLSESDTHGLPVAATPSRDSTTAWWPCTCSGCTSPLWFSTCITTMSPSHTMNIGTFG